MFTTDVLVVGAGPAGLATAVTALRHGARVLVVERRACTSTIPRATGMSTRTMEIFRQGVADAVRTGASTATRTSHTRPLADEPTRSCVGYPPCATALAVSPTYPASARRTTSSRCWSRGASAGRQVWFGTR